MGNITSISLTKQTKDRIAKQGAKGDTFEHILLRLLEYWEVQRR